MSHTHTGTKDRSTNSRVQNKTDWGGSEEGHSERCLKEESDGLWHRWRKKWLTDQPYKGMVKAKHRNELTCVKSAWHTVSIPQCLLIFIGRWGKET